MEHKEPPPQYELPVYTQQHAYPPPQATPGNTTIVLVGPSQPPPQQTIIVKEREGVNHLLHFIITLLCCPWVFVWICLCITDDS